LTVHLVQESASASVPTRLIRPTAKVASLIAAEGAVTAGVVSAEVARLVEGVFKAMLFSKVKLVTVALMVGATLAAGGTGLVHRVQAADGPSREPAGEATKGQDRLIEVPQPRSDKSLISLQRAQDQPVEQMVSYPFTTDPDKVYEFPTLTVDYRDFHLKAGRVSVVPIAIERGSTGAMVIGDGTFRYTPEADKVIEGHFRAAPAPVQPGRTGGDRPAGEGGASQRSRDLGVEPASAPGGHPALLAGHQGGWPPAGAADPSEGGIRSGALLPGARRLADLLRRTDLDRLQLHGSEGPLREKMTPGVIMSKEC
jgi:hypothetical protein